MVLLASGSFSQRKINFEIVILKLNCTFHTSKYQLFMKNINFFTPGFSKIDYISQANDVIDAT